MRMLVALLVLAANSASAFLLPQRPQIFLANKGVTAAVAQYVTASTLAAEAAPILGPRARELASEISGLPYQAVPVESILFACFGVLFASGYSLAQLSRRR